MAGEPANVGEEKRQQQLLPPACLLSAWTVKTTGGVWAAPQAEEEEKKAENDPVSVYSVAAVAAWAWRQNCLLSQWHARQLKRQAEKRHTVAAL